MNPESYFFQYFSKKRRFLRVGGIIVFWTSKQTCRYSEDSIYERREIEDFFKETDVNWYVERKNCIFQSFLYLKILFHMQVWIIFGSFPRIFEKLEVLDPTFFTFRLFWKYLNCNNFLRFSLIQKSLENSRNFNNRISKHVNEKEIFSLEIMSFANLTVLPFSTSL